MSLVKAFSRIGSQKCKFKVQFIPISVEIYTSKNVDFKLQIHRGDKKIHEIKGLKCFESLNKFDIKTVQFPKEIINIDTSFFIEKGVPQAKLLTLAII